MSISWVNAFLLCTHTHTHTDRVLYFNGVERETLLTHTFNYRHMQSSKSIGLGNTEAEAPREAVDDRNEEHGEESLFGGAGGIGGK